MKPLEPAVHSALRDIVNNRSEKSLNWAVNYAQEGLSMTGEELRVQCLYVLNNIVYWRGGLAKQVRATLKAFAGIK